MPPKPMTNEELRAIGQELYPGRWQTALAHDLGINPSAIRKYLRGRKIPNPTAIALRAIYRDMKGGASLNQ